MEDIKNDIDINEIKIIIADDERKTCEEIKEYLRNYPQIKILGIANTDNEEIKMIMISKAITEIETTAAIIPPIINFPFLKFDR